MISRLRDSRLYVQSTARLPKSLELAVAVLKELLFSILKVKWAKAPFHGDATKGDVAKVSSGWRSRWPPRRPNCSDDDDQR